MAGQHAKHAQICDLGWAITKPVRSGYLAMQLALTAYIVALCIVPGKWLL